MDENALAPRRPYRWQMMSSKLMTRSRFAGAAKISLQKTIYKDGSDGECEAVKMTHGVKRNVPKPTKNLTKDIERKETTANFHNFFDNLTPNKTCHLFLFLNLS